MKHLDGAQREALPGRHAETKVRGANKHAVKDLVAPHTEGAHELEAADDAEVAAFRQQAGATPDLFVPPPPPKAKKDCEPAPIRIIKKKRRKDTGDKTSKRTAAAAASADEQRAPP